MSAPPTEMLHALAKGLDKRSLTDIAMILAEGQIAAAASVQEAVPAIARAAAAMAATIRKGGVLHYVAAGSSGLMAAADAQELGGTFSIPAAQVRIHMAGGLPTGVQMTGETEDGTGDLAGALADLSPADTVVAVSASGTTPYTLAAAGIARTAGATIVAIANNPETALLDAADHPICLASPPEVVSGSTRMGAGTAQKIALNTLSTLMAVRLGHVHDGMMVNLRADNTKLRNRALNIVRRVTGTDETVASTALDLAGGKVKPAVLIAARGVPAHRANAILRETEGNLRAALAKEP